MNSPTTLRGGWLATLLAALIVAAPAAAEVPPPVDPVIPAATCTGGEPVSPPVQTPEGGAYEYAPPNYYDNGDSWTVSVVVRPRGDGQITTAARGPQWSSAPDGTAVWSAVVPKPDCGPAFD